MKRLTKKDKYGRFYTNQANCRNIWSSDGKKLEGEYFENKTLAIDGKAIDKLGRLENIEEKLGVNLLTLFKALKDGIWTKTTDRFWGYKVEKTPVFVEGVEIGYKDYYEVDKDYNILVEEKNTLCIYIHDYDYISRIARVKDYGRTWALTKEVLEK